MKSWIGKLKTMYFLNFSEERKMIFYSFFLTKLEIIYFILFQNKMNAKKIFELDIRYLVVSMSRRKT